jgi:hypothetical protein
MEANADRKIRQYQRDAGIHSYPVWITAEGLIAERRIGVQIHPKFPALFKSQIKLLKS